MEATDRESEAPILKSGMKRFFKRCWRTGITAECLSVLWFSQQLLIRLTSHVVGVLLRTRGSAESRASSWDQSAAALHPPDVHVMSTGLLVCCWSRWMCSETAAARSFAIFPPDKTQTHHLSPAAPHIFPWRAERKNLLCYRTKQFCGEMPSEGEPLICLIDRLVVPRCSWLQCYSHQGCFGRTGPVWSEPRFWVPSFSGGVSSSEVARLSIVSCWLQYSWHHRQEVKSSDATTFTFILLGDLEIAWSLNSTH